MSAPSQVTYCGLTAEAPTLLAALAAWVRQWAEGRER